MNKQKYISSGLYSPFSSVEEIINNSKKLIIAISGFGYTLDMPVFYYLEKHLDELGSDLIQVDLGYSRNSEFLSMTDEEQDRVFNSDIKILKSLLNNYHHNEIILIGKSLGSTVCLKLLDDPGIKSNTTKSIWLTPGTYAEEIYNKLSLNRIQNLVIYGSSDPYTTNEMIHAIKPYDNIDFYCVHEGDHSLKSGDVINTVQELKMVMESIFTFIRE